LGFQQGAFSIENGQKVCYPELIPLARQVLRSLTRQRRGKKQIPAFLLAGKGDERVLGLLKRQQDALLILRQSRFGARIGASDARPDTPQVKRCLEDARTDGERITATVADVQEGTGLQSHTAGESDPREEISGHHPDVG
jgi:hypothetical protein